jgi:hypothetical protein
LSDVGVGGRKIFKGILKKSRMKVWNGYGPQVDCCEYDYIPSGFIKGENFLSR